MAREYVAIVRDDLTGEKLADDDVKTAKFAWEGVSYTIDLSRKNYEAFEAAIGQYVAAGTREGSAARSTSRRSAAPRSGKEDLSAIRAWGKENGFKVNDRGRVSAELKDAYNNAH